MTQYEQSLPRGIIDINEVIGSMTMQAIVDNPEHVGSLSPQSDELLRGLLHDPFAFDGLERGKERGATFVWWLGAMRDMSRAVLRSFHDVVSLDEDIENYMTGQEAIIQQMLQRDPALLEHLEDSEQAAFWQMLGCNLSEEELPPSAMIGALRVLLPAAHIPESTLEAIRTYRDTTTSLNHEPVRYMAISDQDMLLEEVELDDREKEMCEASTRVICGGFVARYSGRKEDHRLFRQALADFSDRAFEDPTGLEHALNLANVLSELSDYRQGDNSPALQLFAKRLEQGAAGMDLTRVAVEQLSGLVHAAHHLQHIDGAPDLQDFIARGAATLSDFRDFNNMIDDPSHEVTAKEPQEALVQMLASSKSSSTAQDINSLLQELNGPQPELSTEEIMASFRTDGYDHDYVRSAIHCIATELNPERRESLTRDFDQIIGAALENLPEGHILRHVNGLHDIHTIPLLMECLAYFKTGRTFLDGLTRNYLQGMLACIAHPEAWKNQRHSQNRLVATWLKTIHDALWQNRYFYAEAEDRLELLDQIAIAVTEVTDFIIGRDEHESQHLLELVHSCVEGFKGFALWTAQSHTDPQDIVGQEPVHAILSRYKNHAVRSHE